MLPALVSKTVCSAPPSSSSFDVDIERDERSVWNSLLLDRKWLNICFGSYFDFHVWFAYLFNKFSFRKFVISCQLTFKKVYLIPSLTTVDWSSFELRTVCSLFDSAFAVSSILLFSESVLKLFTIWSDGSGGGMSSSRLGIISIIGSFCSILTILIKKFKIEQVCLFYSR